MCTRMPMTILAIGQEQNTGCPEKVMMPGRPLDASLSNRCMYFCCTLVHFWFCNRREAPEGSKVPVVCLERLKILVSKCPPQGHQRICSPTDPGPKPEGTVSQKLQRERPSEVVLATGVSPSGQL